MYRCDVCREVVEAGVVCNRLVVETRAVEYPRRERAYWRPPKRGQEKGRWIDDPGGSGVEAVHEISACTACYAKALALERGEPEYSSV